MNPIRKILVPTDFSAHAEQAFRTACALAGPLGAEVVLFHVAQPPAVVTASGELLATPDSAPVNVWERFHHRQASDTKVRVRHEVIVAERPSARHILDLLDKQGCDLIVMGTHGRSRLTDLLLGGVTQDVVRSARCPVMVVKAPPPARVPSDVAATAQPHARMS